MEENRTILIVDDEPETLKGYSDFLLPSASGGAARRSSRASTADAAGAQSAPGSNEKYNLLMADSGEKAVALAEKELAEGRRIAAGFFDVKLGAGMDGLATIQAIQKLDRDIHCVVVTAYHDRTVDEINRLFGEEFKDQWDYLNKPFTQGEIVQKARQMISAWNRRRQLAFLHEQLLRSERLAAVGQVARGIGHEFGNILLRIMGKTDIALMEKDVAKIHDHLKVVLSASERAGVIVRNLQSFSKTEPNYQFISIESPLDESISLISHELVKASVTLEKSYLPTPNLRIDSGALAQVFLNILINAIHATPKGGKITVTTTEQADEKGVPGVAVRIADTGSGIPDDVLKRIFDYAFSTKGDRGSGLGLSISKEIVESHGGRILVKTEVGKGTEFTIWLKGSTK